MWIWLVTLTLDKNKSVLINRHMQIDMHIWSQDRGEAAGEELLYWTRSADNRLAQTDTRRGQDGRGSPFLV